MACALVLGVAGCGSTGVAEDARAPAATPDAAATTVSDPGTLRFGEPHEFDNGLSLTVAPPRSFVPSQTSRPPAEHAVAFEVTIRNDSGQPYRLSQLSIAATINGAPATELKDAAHGVHRLGDATKPARSGRPVLVTVAFAATAEPHEAALTFQPDPDGDTVTYSGPTSAPTITQ
jgi:hypothetical protein